MAVAVSRSPLSFFEDVAYALSQLGRQHLKIKEEQQRAIEVICRGDDVFVSLPTGFGKSICFHVLPFLFDRKLGCMDGERKSCVIVISPLISLMVDQVRNLRASGVEAVVISSVSRQSVDEEFLANEENLRSCSLIYSSPEALLHIKWREVFENSLVTNRVCAVVVDEAHCVSKW